MSMILQKNIFKAVIYLLVICSVVGCTNSFDLKQVDKRVSESLEHEYPAPADIDPAGDNQFTFAVFGDSHLGSRFGEVLQSAIDQVKSYGDAFVVSVGDITDSGASDQYQNFIDAFSQAGILFRPALGNHDIFFDGWSNFRDKFVTATYSFNADNVHFVILDSANGVLGQKQLTWLDQNLEQTDKPIKIIVTHTPPYTGSFPSIWRMSSDEEVAIFKDICYRRDVSLVFSGHYHGFRETKIANTQFVTTGAVNTFTEIGEHKHFVRVRIDGTQFSYEKIDL